MATALCYDKITNIDVTLYIVFVCALYVIVVVVATVAPHFTLIRIHASHFKCYMRKC